MSDPIEATLAVFAELLGQEEMHLTTGLARVPVCAQFVLVSHGAYKANLHLRRKFGDLFCSTTGWSL